MKTLYVGRIGLIRITAQEGSGQLTLTLLSGTSARLDEVEMAALVRVMREAQRRAERAGVELPEDA